MSFNVNLYTFKKHENSTARPTGSGTQLSCNIKTPTSLISPVGEFSLSSNPISYNYAYISEFKRYYFITDWTFDRGLWIASMICDVLATYKSDIGGSTLYVLRSASRQTGSLKDNMYPLKVTYTDNFQTWTPYNLTAMGYFYVNAIGGTSTDQYTYCMSHANFGIFKQKMLAFENEAGYFADEWNAIKNSHFDPINYITNCFWLPVNVIGTSGTTVTSITAGNYNINVGQNIYLAPPPYLYTTSHTFTIADHPLTATRGVYCNASPYSEHLLRLGGFGNVKVPADMLTESTNTVKVELTLDVYTNSAVAKCFVNGNIFAKIDGTLGMNVPIAQRSKNVITGVTSIIAGATAIGTSAMMTAMTGGATMPSLVSGTLHGASAIVGGVDSLFSQQTSTTGSNGSSANMQGFGLYSIYHDIADDDNTNNGRPLHEYVQLSTLSGFIQVQKGEVEINGTQDEANQIRRWLESGFYYE